MKTKFTDGEWIRGVITPDLPFPFCNITSNDKGVLFGTGSLEEAKANIDLICMAPDMFYQIVLLANSNGYYWCFEIIQKVTGKYLLWESPDFNELVQQAKDYLNSKIKVQYTSWKVINPEELHKKYGVVHPNKFGTHSTNIYGTQAYDPREGIVSRLKITGRLTNANVDVLVVENKDSKNKHPHITLSTAPGVRPYQSNEELLLDKWKINPLNDYVDVIFKNVLKK